MKPLIFSVEDDINIQNVIKIALENSQFQTVSFDNAKELFKKLEEILPDLFLLDVMLPGINGLEIIKKLKKTDRCKDIPIMIISAKTSEIDRVIGIDLGADDYLIKPFGVLELISRVKALLRRKINLTEPDILNINGLILDIAQHQASYNEKLIKMTKKQYELLAYLMRKHHKLISRDELLNNVWGYDFVGETRTLDVHIKELRRKLKLVGIQKTTIETVRGIGYKFVL